MNWGYRKLSKSGILLHLGLCIVACMRLHAQTQAVTFDASGAVEVKPMWTWLTDRTSQLGYIKDLGGVENKNVVMFLAAGRYNTLSTYPRLTDTVNSVATWNGPPPSPPLCPLDYDGIPPLEYISANSTRYVYRRSEDPSVFDVIDTIPARESFAPWDRRRTDVDNDGLVDIVDPTSDAQTEYFNVILNGADRGRGRERVVSIPRYYPDVHGRSQKAVRVMRCGDGKVRTVVVGTTREGYSGVYLLDMVLGKTDTGYAVRFQPTDSVEALYTDDMQQIVTCHVVIDDALHRKQYAVVNWYAMDGVSLRTVVYDITDGTFKEALVCYPAINPAVIRSFDNDFDDGVAMIGYVRGGSSDSQDSPSMYFARITDMHRPFAYVSIKNAFDHNSCTFINDQSGDGVRDLLTTDPYQPNPARVRLFDFKGVASGTDEQVQPEPDRWAVLEGYLLSIVPPAEGTLSVELADISGRVQRIGETIPASITGPTTIDLRQTLSGIAAGSYFLRVRVGERTTTLTYIR